MTAINTTGKMRKDEAMILPVGVKMALTPDIQELILLPTEKCNFRCSYCYEDFELGAMPEWLQLGIMRLIERRAPTLKGLSLNWFGGEPLLAKNVVIRIAQHAKLLSTHYGFRLNGSFTTNAYLLDRVLFEELLALNHDFYQITLDGWKEVHDLTRRRADGQGTFTRIWNNLLAIAQVDGKFDILLRVHVSPSNLDSVRVLCRQLNLALKGDSRFRLTVQDIRDLGGDNGKQIAPVNKPLMDDITSELEAIFYGQIPATQPVAIRRPRGESAGNFRAMTLDERMDLAGNDYVCYAAKANSLLIRADGRIGKCTVALNDDRNSIGKLTEDGLVQLDQNKLKPWLRGLASLDTGQLGCPWQGMTTATSTPIGTIPIAMT